MAYGENLITNPSAETGDVSSWTSTNVTTASGGTDGSYCFSLLQNAEMFQSIGVQVYPYIFKLQADFAPDTPWGVDPYVGIYAELKILFADSSVEYYTAPLRAVKDAGGGFYTAEAIIESPKDSIDDETTDIVLRIFTNTQSGKLDNIRLEKETSVTEGGVTTFYQDSVPTADKEGDLWVDTGDNNKLYRWNGLSWDECINAVRAGVEYGGLTIDEIEGILNTGAIAQDVMFDRYGINPHFIRRYPNKCWNSSFEGFDETTKKPHYWSGGQSTSTAAYDGTYSLWLQSGQTVTQEQDELGVGFSMPDWWSGVSSQTRVAFKYKGGPITVRMLTMTGNNPLTLIDSSGNSSTSLTFSSVSDWNDGRATFKVDTSGVSDKIYLEFSAGGTVYVDAVDIGPDYTGKWPPLYEDGPRSIGSQQVAFEPGEGGGVGEGFAILKVKVTYDPVRVVQTTQLYPIKVKVTYDPVRVVQTTQLYPITVTLS